MRNAMLAVVLSSVFVCGSAGVSAALVCPVPAPGANAAQDQTIAQAISAGDALADVGKLNAAIDALRAKGIGNAIIVDALIGAYCPGVARAALTDEQKRAQVRRFAARVTRTVYALDSVDAVILDVPFPPAVLDAVNAKAAAEKVTPEAWVAGAIDRVLKGTK